MTESIYTEPARHLTVTETAKLMRQALRETFPGVKFSVRSSSYAGGASINVYWTDGPTDTAVSRLVTTFEGADFDGMIDLKTYHDTLVASSDGSVERVHHGADYVLCHRSLSEAYARQLHAELVAFASMQSEVDHTQLATATPADYATEYLVWIECEAGSKSVSGSLTQLVRRYAELRDAVSEATLALNAS